ncbi:MAG: carboxypeptidase regulatory-like domain-containing protein, partial [Bryobacteraceae bacterium]
MRWTGSSILRNDVRLCIAIALAAFAPALWAQFTSSVNGTVADQTGAVVPEVRLALTNVQTGVTIDTACNAAGIYRFPDLPPGRYRLRASKTGFQTVVQENIVLESGRIQEISIVLPVGAVTQEVTVTGVAVSVETTNPKISTVVTNEYVQNIPLGLRNVYNVIQLAPGVTGFGMGGDSFAAISGAGATANGMRMLSNGYYVDGSPVNDMADGGAAKLAPNPDSVEEVRVSTNDYSAQWGKNAGILTQVVSKSGANDYHGTLYW